MAQKSSPDKVMNYPTKYLLQVRDTMCTIRSFSILFHQQAYGMDHIDGTTSPDEATSIGWHSNNAPQLAI